MDIVHSTLKKVREGGLLETGDNVLVGVSGGADSSVLLDVLSVLSTRIGFKLHIAHVNYHLRGRESDRDQRFVIGLGKKYSCTVHIAHPKTVMGNGDNLQNMAREFRYHFFLKTAKELKANKIALAHHADDQAETVLLHIIRGAGLKGLTGMRSSRVLIRGLMLVRPLLSLERSEIRSYAKAKKVKFVEDSTNRTNKYERNVIRNEILPRLKKANPRVVANIYKTSRIIQDDEKCLDSLAKKAYSRLFRDGNAQRRALLKLDTAIIKRVFRLAYAGITGATADLLSDHVEKMVSISTSSKRSGSYDLPHGLKFARHMDRISLRPKK